MHLATLSAAKDEDDSRLPLLYLQQAGRLRNPCLLVLFVKAGGVV